jgi:formamidopyrimidine-DNA glycosylase
MPELPEVETVRRGLLKALTGARIERIEQHRGDLRAPFPKNLPRRLKGRKIEAVQRRAKYLLIALDGGETLLLHLGMSGRLLLAPNDKKPPARHDHLVFHFTNGITLRFNDPRRFGLCDLIATKDLPRHKLLRALGIEPLGPRLTPGFVAAAFAGKKTSIKDALMDQRLIAGLGNIYVSEALFYAGINPKKKAGRVAKAQFVRLAPAIRKVLRAAIEAGGSSLRDYRRADGELGYFQHHFAVYDRMGKRCPGCSCDIAETGGIRRIAQGGRSTFYCPIKQV